MYKINKVKNYKQFAKLLEEKTGCSVKIAIVENNHIHYQLNDKNDMSLGVLCINNGDVSFAPLTTHDEAVDEQYIIGVYMVQFDELAKLLNIFKEMFVTDEV